MNYIYREWKSLCHDHFDELGNKNRLQLILKI